MFAWSTEWSTWSGSSDIQKWLIHRSYFLSGRWKWHFFLWHAIFLLSQYKQNVASWIYSAEASSDASCYQDEAAQPPWPQNSSTCPTPKNITRHNSPLSTAAFGICQGLTWKMKSLYQCCFQVISLGIALLSVKNSEFEILCDKNLCVISSLL